MSTTKTKPKSSTEDVIAAMLRENTGVALCDSGGTPKYDATGKYIGSEQGYGRAYERNQARDFTKEPRVFFEVHDSGFDVTINVYHWLTERLAFDAKMNARFRRFAKTRDDQHELELMEEFPNWLKGKGENVTGLYGDEVERFDGTNTYNGEDALSQTLQYVYFEIDGTSYVLLQIHNGADVRGGYTDAKVFTCKNEGTDMFDNARVELWGERPAEDPNQLTLPGVEGPKVDQVSWMSENGGYSFMLQNGYELWDRKQKGSVPDLKSSDHKDNVFRYSTDLALRGNGVVVVDVENKRLYCPVSGWELKPTF